MANKKTKEILDNMRFSFSSVNAYYTCPKMFYLTYILKKDKINNAFAEWGSFCHSILERYYKGELELFELSEEYEAHYKDSVKIRFPDNKYVDMNVSYRDAGKKYFDNFEDDFSDYKIVGVEQQLETKIGRYKFIGYIDLILKDKDENFYIVDHKSKSKFSNKSELRHYLFQLYIYSKYIYETYGVYPKQLIFNMFRAGEIVREDFDEKEYIKALNWAESTIDQMYEDDKFSDKILIDYTAKRKSIEEYTYPDFFCCELCSPRKSCPRSKVKYKTK